MSGDQASGLRQWSQAHASRNDTDGAPAELVVMVWGETGPGIEQLSQRLALPDGVSHWQPRPVVLSASLPDAVPDTSWWMLQLGHLSPREAPKLAEALRSLHRAGMPQTVLLDAPESLAVAGLISAARTHLGVRLLQNERTWHHAVMAAPGPG
ncbi:hypothetical protein [Kushneria indalinina]|uniref:Uncharacterized protein n=1 Tax=Kushneria indalinina DSM 14324 TaxID=1122140 RepID=A0A3D9DV86_9GAMM|nr:hypothetical protein [Kushneria indalinina]REC94693.1 hypothetical protein C8D72_1519 [Kushneria indalinina DSM 14324]